MSPPLLPLHWRASQLPDVQPTSLPQVRVASHVCHHWRVVSMRRAPAKTRCKRVASHGRLLPAALPLPVLLFRPPHTL